MNKFSCAVLFKRIVISMLWLLLLIFGSLCAFMPLNVKAAAESAFGISVNGSEFKKDDVVEFALSLEGIEGTSAFLIEADYPEGFKFDSTERSSKLKSGYCEIFDSGSKLSFVYTYKDGKVLAPEKDFLVFKFKVTGEEAAEKSFIFNITGVLNEYGNNLMPDSTGEIKVNINPEKVKAKLNKLIPSAGSLNPSFKSDIYEYKMYVPYSVSSITFTTELEGEAEISVNRKNLGSGGSITEFIITVKEADGEKQFYKVLVTRGEYVRYSNKGSTGGTSSSEKESIASEVSQSETSEIKIEVNETGKEEISKAPELIIKEPEAINKESTQNNSFTAFLFGAGATFTGVLAGVIIMLIAGKIHKRPK